MVSNAEIDRALSRAFARQLESFDFRRGRNTLQGRLRARGGGARCPECASPDAAILYSWDTEEGRKRRLQCLACFGVFVTLEKFTEKRSNHAARNIGVPVPGQD